MTRKFVKRSKFFNLFTLSVHANSSSCLFLKQDEGHVVISRAGGHLGNYRFTCSPTPPMAVRGTTTVNCVLVHVLLGLASLHYRLIVSRTS